MEKEEFIDQLNKDWFDKKLREGFELSRNEKGAVEGVAMFETHCDTGDGLRDGDNFFKREVEGSFVRRPDFRTTVERMEAHRFPLSIDGFKRFKSIEASGDEIQKTVSRLQTVEEFTEWVNSLSTSPIEMDFGKDFAASFVRRAVEEFGPDLRVNENHIFNNVFECWF